MSKKHSKWAPSASERWFECPGSVALVGDDDSPTSPQAEEGTIAHAVAEARLRELLKKRKTQAGILPLWEMVKGKHASDFVREDDDPLEHEDFEIDMEFCDAVGEYVSFCMDIHKANGKCAETKVETLVEVIEECEGTVDFDSAQDWGRLTIVDLKFGKGIYVKVEDNSQAMIYLLGASKLGIYDSYQINIVQPRWRDATDRFRTLDVTQEELDEFEAVLTRKIIATKDPDAPLIAGEHCQWCPAKLRCPAQLALVESSTGLNVVDGEGELFIAGTLSGDDLARIMKQKATVIKFFSEVDKEADTRLAKNANSVPGYHRVHTAGNRKFRNEDALVDEINTFFGKSVVETLYEHTLLSPAKIETLMPPKSKERKDMKRIVGQYAYKPDGGVKVVPVTDKRPVVTSASEAFDDDLDLE